MSFTVSLTNMFIRDFHDQFMKLRYIYSVLKRGTFPTKYGPGDQNERGGGKFPGTPA